MLFALTGASYALGLTQLPGMTLRTWGIEDGLPNHEIRIVAQTPDGYLWLGTQHGLLRFDGFRFYDVGEKIIPELHEFGVASLLVGRDGSLWIASVGKGVIHLAGESVTRYGTESGLRALSIRTIAETVDGLIWAGTDRGLYLLKDGRFELVHEFGDEIITALKSDGADGLWIVGARLVHYRHGAATSIVLPTGFRGPSHIVRAPDGTLWIGSYGGLLAVRSQGQIQVVRSVGTAVCSLFLDTSGRVWVGTSGAGLLLIRPGGEVVHVLGDDDTRHRVIYDVTQVHNGDMWIGTESGLLRLSLTGIDLIKGEITAASNWGSIFLDTDNSVWLSAGQLSRYSNSMKAVDVNKIVGRYRVRTALRDRQGCLWIGTDSNGLYRLSRGKIVFHYAWPTRISITGFLEDRDGSIWIGTDAGLARWTQGHLEQYGSANHDPLSSTTVRIMALAADGAIWTSTPGGLGLFRNGVYQANEMTDHLAHSRISSLYTQADGSLWLGTGTGLYLWHGGRLRHLLLPESESQNHAIISILRDARKRFLFAESTTVFRIEQDSIERSLSSCTGYDQDGTCQIRLPPSTEVFAVTRETGAVLYSDQHSVGVADLKGAAWFASYRGIVHICAAPVARSEAPPPIILNHITVDGVPVSVAHPITLSSSVRNIEIQATPILLSSKTGLQMRRRLIGLDKSWSEIPAGSSSNYGRLPAGRYTFRVEAFWPDTGAVSFAEIPIEQVASFYRRTWFLVFCLLILAAATWAFHRTRVHSLEVRFRAVAEERRRIAREIHDTLLQGCIGAITMLEAIELSEGPKSPSPQPSLALPYLASLSFVRQRLADTTKDAREAIWNLSSADQSKWFHELIQDMMMRLTTGTTIHGTSGFHGTPLSLSPRTQHELLMASREALNNAIVHGLPNNLDVQVMYDTETVTIILRDDGKGFIPRELDASPSVHFGISGMQARMTKCGGSLSLESSPHKGTLVRLTVPR
jgi:ligand-binding sensor domain-containing protein/signal transduction histidine kinase